MTFAAEQIPVPHIDGARDWPTWGNAIVASIKAATEPDHLSAIIDLNQESFAECAESAPKAYASLCEALDRRRRQIKAGV